MLTSSEKSGNINKLSQRDRVTQRKRPQKKLKNLKKGVDKRGKMC